MSEPCDKSAQRKNEILDSALKCFAEEGYHSTTNRKIACRAGITEGLIYHYFPNKKSLLQEIIRAKFHQDCSPLYRFLSTWEERIKKGPVLFDSFPDFLRGLGQSMLDSMDINKDVHRIVVSEFRLLEEDGEPLYAKLIMELSVNRIVGLLKWWKDSLDLPLLDPVRDVWFFTGPLFAFFHFQEILSGKKVIPIDRSVFLEGLIEHFFHGIGFDHSPAESSKGKA
ncbi:MAG: TetR/AcrR family transcriptional regulator [Leptospirales bacterium]